MSSQRLGWWLNLDAELELARPEQYRTPRRLAEQARAHIELLRLLTLDDAILSQEHTAVDFALCWSPTPSALAACRQAGYHVPLAPPLEVLRAVNHRRFIMQLPGGIERRFLDGGAEPGCLETPPGTGGRWRGKRAFGFAGKGQRRLEVPLSDDDQRWIRSSLARGGLLIEPEVSVVQEFSLHGYVDSQGLELGAICLQRCDEHGAVHALERARSVPDVWSQSLVGAAEAAADALLVRGYFGPFGIDAYSWQGPAGIELNPIGELNARFTVGWSIGLGARRQAVLERYAETRG